MTTRIPVRYAVPNAITCGSLTLGVLSIFQASTGGYRVAGWLVVMSVLFDKLDGTVARLLKATSEFGLQLDSFSDFVTFGIAPAFLLFAIARDASLVDTALATDPTYQLGVRAVCILYVLATVLRLAKYNVITDRLPGGYFLGVPTTLAGGIVAAWLLTALKHRLPAPAFAATPVLYAVLAGLMVSNIKMPKIQKPQSRIGTALLAAVIVAAYICGLTWTAPEFLLAAGLGLFAVGVVYGLTVLRDAPTRPLEDVDHVEEILPHDDPRPAAHPR